MSFQFALRGLLRYRENIEAAELQRLQTAAALVTSARMELESLDAKIAAMQQEAAMEASSGVYGAELRFESFRESLLKQQREALHKRLVELERRREEQQARYTRSRQQREIVSSLRQRQYNEYLAEQCRREQQQADELFLTRFDRTDKD